MSQGHFLLYDHQKPIRLYPERVSFYLQGEIIEAFNDNREVYYLFFYKSHFLTAAKTTRLRRKSFIAHAFSKGLVFENPHPLIKNLLSENHPCHMIGFNPLLNKLEMQYTPQEKAFILTFFESFFPKKQLFEEMKSIFYEYRRNGQRFLGYRIIRILMEFAPNHSFVKQISKDMIFTKFAALYSEKSEQLFEKDILFAEKVLYDNIENERCFQQLTVKLEKESRWIELIALYTSNVALTPTTAHYTPLKNLLEQHLSENETVYILEQISNKISAFSPLQHDLFSKYINNHNINEVTKMMSNDEFKLSTSQVQVFGDLLEKTNSETLSLQPEMLQPLLEQIFSLYPERVEKLLSRYVTVLLKSHGLVDIIEWLKPFNQKYNNLEIVEKINTMHKISDDLDQMQTLGELYYEFMDLDKAIECFSWEMELNPTNPKSPQWLSKLYREKGMEQESDAYRQLCISLQKRA